MGAAEDFGVKKGGAELEVVDEFGGTGDFVEGVKARHAFADYLVLNHFLTSGGDGQDGFDDIFVSRTAAEVALMNSRTSASLGWGFWRSRALPMRIMPGVQ
jgi:hypothetical protein